MRITEWKMPPDPSSDALEKAELWQQESPGVAGGMRGGAQRAPGAVALLCVRLWWAHRTLRLCPNPGKVRDQERRSCQQGASVNHCEPLLAHWLEPMFPLKQDRSWPLGHQLPSPDSGGPHPLQGGVLSPVLSHRPLLN